MHSSKSLHLLRRLTHLIKNVSFLWRNAQQTSFDRLKHALTHAPVLAFPDYSLPFTLCANASGLGVGPVLMQQVESFRPHIVVYVSHTLNIAESRYSFIQP